MWGATYLTNFAEYHFNISCWLVSESFEHFIEHLSEQMLTFGLSLCIFGKPAEVPAVHRLIHDYIFQNMLVGMHDVLLRCPQSM